MDGWSQLGAAMGGVASGVPQQQAFNAGALQGQRQADLLDQARKARDQTLARESITPEAIANMYTDPITGQPNDPSVAASVMSSMLRAGIDPRQLVGAQLDQQKLGWGNQAWAAATGANPNLDTINRMDMVRDGKPVDLTKVADGTAYNAMVSPNSPQQSISPTQVGAADIMLKGADAGAANARAADSYANAARARAGIGADKAGNYELVDTPQGLMRVNKLNPADSMPVTGADGTAITRATPNVNNATAPTTDDLSAIGATKFDAKSGRTVIDPVKAQAFMSWQTQQAASDPRMLNSSYAVQKFAALKQSAVGTPGAAPAAVDVTEDSGPTPLNPNAPVVVGTKGTIFDPNSLAAQMAGAKFKAAQAATPAGIAGTMSGGAPAPAAAAPPSPVKGVARAPNGAYLLATQMGSAAVAGGVPPTTPAAIAAGINLGNQSGSPAASSSTIVPGQIAPPSGIAAVMAGNAPAGAPPVPAGIAGAMTGKPSAAIPAALLGKPSSAAAKVSRAPSGAYLPTTKQDYDSLPVGAIYIRPGETVPRTKGGA